MNYASFDPSQIGIIMKGLREQKGETLAEAAESIGISQSAIAMYESGARVPRDEIKIRIAKHYGLTVEAIFYPQEQHVSCYFGPETATVQIPRIIPDPLA